MYKLITFDANNTLLKLKRPVGQIYSYIASKYGYSFDPNKIEKGFKLSWKTMNKEHPNFGRSTIGWRKWWKTIVIQSFAASHRGLLDESCIGPVADELIETFNTDECWTLSDGCMEVLNSIHKKQINIGIISNVDPRLHSILKCLNIYDYFNFILTSYEVDCIKPDSKIFQLAREKSGMKFEDSKLILHVGDSIELDYFGAITAGWDAALITSKKDHLLKSYSSIDSKKLFNNLNEFNEYIKI